MKLSDLIPYVGKTVQYRSPVGWVNARVRRYHCVESGEWVILEWVNDIEYMLNKTITARIRNVKRVRLPDGETV